MAAHKGCVCHKKRLEFAEISEDSGIKMDWKATFTSWVMAMVVLVTMGNAEAETVARPKWVKIGQSLQGRPIEVITYGQGSDRILIGATIHGNEWAGTPVVDSLLNYFDNNSDILEGRTVAVIPVINPDGFYHKTRGNANGVDLNRNFPAENRANCKRYGMTAFSEPESKALYDFINKFDPARVIIFHQPLYKVDWDGPAKGLAQHMARHTILSEERIGARPGSMGSHYGVDRKLPIITYELPRHAEKETTETLWNTYGRATLAAITWPDGVSLAQFEGRSRRDLAVPVFLLIGCVAMISLGLIIGQRKPRT